MEPGPYLERGVPRRRAWAWAQLGRSVGPRGASGRLQCRRAAPASLLDCSSVFTQNLFGKMADILEKIKK